jgi:hypothetical protein
MLTDTITDARSPAPHVADRLDPIRVSGARESNLGGLDALLP